MSRCKAIVLPMSFFEHIIKTGNVISVLSGLPEDTEILSIEKDIFKRRVILICRHSSFAIVPEGAALLEEYITFKDTGLMVRP